MTSRSRRECHRLRASFISSRLSHHYLTASADVNHHAPFMVVTRVFRVCTRVRQPVCNTRRQSGPAQQVFLSSAGHSRPFGFATVVRPDRECYRSHVRSTSCRRRSRSRKIPVRIRPVVRIVLPDSSFPPPHPEYHEQQQNTTHPLRSSIHEPAAHVRPFGRHGLRQYPPCVCTFPRCSLIGRSLTTVYHASTAGPCRRVTIIAHRDRNYVKNDFRFVRAARTIGFRIDLAIGGYFFIASHSSSAPYGSICVRGYIINYLNV